MLANFDKYLTNRGQYCCLPNKLAEFGQHRPRSTNVGSHRTTLQMFGGVDCGPVPIQSVQASSGERAINDRIFQLNGDHDDLAHVRLFRVGQRRRFLFKTCSACAQAVSFGLPRCLVRMRFKMFSGLRTARTDSSQASGVGCGISRTASPRYTHSGTARRAPPIGRISLGMDVLNTCTSAAAQISNRRARAQQARFGACPKGVTKSYSRRMEASLG